MRVDDLAKLSGLVAPETGARLAELAGDVDPDLAIVELGSFRGKSTCYLAEGARCGRGAHVYAVEPWDLAGNPDGKHGFARIATREYFELQVASLDLADRITAIQGFSTDVAKQWRGPRVGLLFVDGSHEYSDVRADFEAWSEHLADDAVVAFDDYRTKRNPGVTRFVEELEGTWDLQTSPLAIWRR